MGTLKKFSAAEQELLRANPYTEEGHGKSDFVHAGVQGSLLAAECGGMHREHGAAEAGLRSGAARL